jgi:hypothetical protein
MDIFCLIIKIDESFKPTHLQNNHLILNVLGYKSTIMGIEAFVHQIATSLWVWRWAW